MIQEMQSLLSVNDTAFYVFDSQTIKNRIAFLRARLPADISLCYAMKANTFMVGEIVNDVERFELCSPGEADICRTLRVPPEKMVISGVYKTPEVIEALVADPAFGGLFTVESLQQYALLSTLAERYQRRLSLLLRLTNDSQFGINKTDIEDILRDRGAHPLLDIRGIQFFSGTQKSSLKKYAREIEKLDTFLAQLKEAFDFTAQELEYGPGFPVSYFAGEETDEENLLSGFSALLSGMTQKPHLTLEIGRAIAASCGRYFTHVVDSKENNGQRYLLTDGGMHHLVYFGQHMAMQHPLFTVCGKENVPCTTTYTICGALCSMNDILAKQVPLPPITVGDVLCFENTGAYCMVEGISLFLSRDIPAIYLIGTDRTVYCVRPSYKTMTLNTPHYERMF